MKSARNIFKNKKIEYKYTVWDAAEQILYLGLIVIAYFLGFKDGQVYLCQEQDLILVDDQQKGIKECWDPLRFEEYKKQWEQNTIEIGVGLNGSEYNASFGS